MSGNCERIDGCSRAILSWDIRPQMKEADAEIVLQRAREAHPEARPRIITDNGPQFIARDFREFIRLWQTTHGFSSPHYPQSNGKIERYHRTLKEQAIRPKTPLCLEDAKRVVADFINHYNHVRLHSATGGPDPGTGRCWRADAYFYCVEATCPECGWRVPMAPSWMTGKVTHTIARLVPDEKNHRFKFEIESGVSSAKLDAAVTAGTAKDSELICPYCDGRTPMKALRGAEDEGAFDPTICRGR